MGIITIDLLHESKLLVEIEVTKDASSACSQKSEVRKQNFYREKFIYARGLIFGQKSVVGSVVGGRRFMQEMLDFAAINQIKPMIQTMPLSQVNEAMDLVLAGKARYRIVLESEAT